MTQIVPLSIQLGAGNTGRAIGYRVLNLDRTPYATFRTDGVVESAVAGTYYVSGGIIAPDGGAYVVAGTLATDYAEYAISPAPLLPAVAGRRLAVDAYGRAAATINLTPAAMAAALAGNRLTVYLGTTLDVTIAGLAIPANWEAVYCTIKASEAHPDTLAIAQIAVTNPGGAGDGLLWLNEAEAEQLELAGLTVNQAAGTCRIVMHQAVTTELPLFVGVWDLKVITDDDPAEGQLLVAPAAIVVRAPVTRATDAAWTPRI